MGRLTLGLILLLFVLATLPVARAEDVFIPPLPADPDQVEVSLLTVGRGPQVYALYGHTILRVVDPVAKLDIGYNWGIFDFAGPGFVWNFYVGDLRYQMGISDTAALLDQYGRWERRSVVEERLVLTRAQKLALLGRLIWNAQPENVQYDYDQFSDNCSTKPRDHLDQALGGKIREAFGDRPAEEPFRYWIRHGARSSWWVFLGLDQITNDRLDRPVTAWQQMFLPANLRRYLRELPAYDDSGQPIPGRNLLEQTRVLIDLPEPEADPDPYLVTLLLLGGPLLIGALALPGRRTERSAARLIGAMSLAFGLWSAVWGTVLAFNWLASGYAELAHNATLWVLWPLDWYFVGYGLRRLASGQRPASPRLGRLLAGGHLLALGVGTLLWSIGLIRQDLLAVLASSGVLALCFHGVFLRHGSAREARPS